MEIRTFGVGERLSECRRLLGERAVGVAASRLFLLPIPTTRDKKLITGTDVTLRSLCDEVRAGDIVAGYGIPENIRAELCEGGAAVYDGAEDEELLLQNAAMTARGALGYILTESPHDITDMKIGIVGYGRIGSCLLRYLLYLGAHVTVYTRRERVARELCESGVGASVSLDGLSELDILVNTAPARLLTDGEALSFMRGARILDLASGRVFPDAENLVKLSSIPEKFYPRTAGRVYAEGILKFLFSEGEKC